MTDVSPAMRRSPGDGEGRRGRGCYYCIACFCICDDSASQNLEVLCRRRRRRDRRERLRDRIERADEMDERMVVFGLSERQHYGAG